MSGWGPNVEVGFIPILTSVKDRQTFNGISANVGVGFIPILQGRTPICPHLTPLKGEYKITFKPLEDGDKPHPYIGFRSTVYIWFRSSV